MEQPPEEAPEVREEEEKEEVAETQGAAELNGEPEHPLPSSSYTGEEGGDRSGPHTAWGSARSSHRAPVGLKPRGLKPRAWLGPAVLLISCRTVGRGTTSFRTPGRIPAGGEWAL